jgi:NTP pyrophosphatase (non-canonical NTP hydrolase)
MATIILVEDLAGPATLGRGGHSMFVMQWLHGLERLGHEVFFLEFLQQDPAEFRSAVMEYFAATIDRWWHPDRAGLLVESSTESLYGLTGEQVARIAGKAAAVIIRSPYRRHPYPYLEKIRPRILIEQDPGYSHQWAAEGDPADIFGEHDLYYTVGGNIGSPRCSLPTLGIHWRPIWNPVVLDWWTSPRPLSRDRFTTVADWRSFGYLEFEGRMLGPKAEEFHKFIELPRLAEESVEIALNIDSDDPDLAELRDHGWRIESPEVVSTPARYQEYVTGSLGEFSCAKGGYVGTHCGWFSDRSACYLAAGRPVVLQATGFEDVLPTGKGLFAVATVEEAAEALRAIRRDYSLHSAAAHALARVHFDSDRVLRPVLAEAGITDSHPG